MAYMVFYEGVTVDLSYDRIKEFTDHSPGFDYLYNQMFKRALALPKSIPFVELGVRAGGSALLALWAIHESGVNRPLITVDPYGERPWLSADDKVMEKDSDGYGESFWRQTQNLLTEFCVKNELDWWHYRMTDTDFMSAWDGMDVWYQKKELEKKFGFVYLDAEHSLNVIKRQYEWFSKRVVKGGMISIDDIVVTEEDGYSGVYIHDGVNRSYIDF